MWIVANFIGCTMLRSQSNLKMCIHMCMYTFILVYTMIALPTSTVAFTLKCLLVYFTRYGGMLITHFMHASARAYTSFMLYFYCTLQVQFANTHVYTYVHVLSLGLCWNDTSHTCRVCIRYHFMLWYIDMCKHICIYTSLEMCTTCTLPTYMCTWSQFLVYTE